MEPENVHSQLLSTFSSYDSLSHIPNTLPYHKIKKLPNVIHMQLKLNEIMSNSNTIFKLKPVYLYHNIIFYK